ncbi:MAG: prepilin-type N-terminal cleavage/methylation domain-containing protein [Bacillota bacterium]|nr:prepilin-type N-terminal cleavage/methylation domain-containing protein [Bacillota bacterium]
MSRFRPSKQADKDQGFTAVELIIVLVLLGLVATLTLPNLQTWQARYELRTAADQLAADIREMEQLALSYREEGLNPENDNFQVWLYPGSDCYYLKRIGIHSWSQERNMPRSVDLYTTNFDNHKIIIGLRGTVTRGGTVTLQSRRTGEFFYVIVASLTGRVRVSRVPPESWEIS